MPAVINDIDWDWARALRNKINWHWAVYYENDMIDSDYEAHDDLTEWKSLNAQYYDTDWTKQIVKMQTFFLREE